MKHLFLIPVLTFTTIAACMALPGSVPVAEGPVARTIERVLSRTEAYMAMEEPPMPIPEDAQGPVSAAIVVARTMLSLPEVSGDTLMFTMDPIMGIHDMLVYEDTSLDELEREIYLADTARLRSLFASVSIHEPEPAQ